MKTKKQEYKKMTITAIPLKPEQAVLSCCNQEYKGLRDASNQCDLPDPTCTPGGDPSAFALSS